MSIQRIREEIKARIKIRREDMQSIGVGGNYAAAHKLRGQAEELENLYNVLFK